MAGATAELAAYARMDGKRRRIVAVATVPAQPLARGWNGRCSGFLVLARSSDTLTSYGSGVACDPAPVALHRWPVLRLLVLRTMLMLMPGIRAMLVARVGSVLLHHLVV